MVKGHTAFSAPHHFYSATEDTTSARPEKCHTASSMTFDSTAHTRVSKQSSHLETRHGYTTFKSTEDSLLENEAGCVFPGKKEEMCTQATAFQQETDTAFQQGSTHILAAKRIKSAGPSDQQTPQDSSDSQFTTIDDDQTQSRRSKRRRVELFTSAADSKDVLSSKKKASRGYGDIMGKVVDIPAQVFSVDIPDMYYRGVVKGRDKAHNGCVIVQFKEDSTQYWLPAADVRHWLREMELAGRDVHSETTGMGADEFAASVLVEILNRTGDTKRESTALRTFVSSIFA